MKAPLMKTLPFNGCTKKICEIEEFLGQDKGCLKSGMLTDSHNVTVMSGGALRTLLSERKIDVTSEAAGSLEGVYTFYEYYDPEYEIPTTPSWVSENVCPESILSYDDGYEKTSRLLISDIGKPAKTCDGYRNVLGAFADGDKVYVFYDAVYKIIDQRREDEFSKVGSGYIASFDSSYSTGDRGTYIYTLSQLWMDEIDSFGNIISALLTVKLEDKEKCDDKYGYSTLVSEDGDNFRYVTDDYIPYLGEAYTARKDLLYTDFYPLLATDYHVAEKYYDNLQFVRYSNRMENPDTSPYGDIGEHLMVLPEMRLLDKSGSTWTLNDACASMPVMYSAVHHMERLFGFSADKLYASAKGDCTDYTEAQDNEPPDAAWQTVTEDEGGFTAITSFDGKVVAFTKKSMITIDGDELPFSVSRVGAYGCCSKEAMAVCGGWLYFASENDILRYNGSRVESIGAGLSRESRYNEVKISVADGIVAVWLGDYGHMYFFNPQSESWSRRGGESVSLVFPSGESGLMLVKESGSYAAYKIFAEEGASSFDISLGGGARKRICSVTVTAHLEPRSVLTLTDRSGGTLMTIDEVYSDTVTRTVSLRNAYCDTDLLHFKGDGSFTVYSIRVEYVPLTPRHRQIR